MIRTARAYAPGHITGVFRPQRADRDPRGAGSIGAGIVLEMGAVAEVRWSPEARQRTVVRASTGAPLPITADAVGRLRSSLRGRVQVRVTHALPVGQGFGMSASGTVAASIAVASLAGLSRRRAVETAHLAELFGQGGLGGVASILGGGVELRRRPGVPPWGQVEHRAWTRGTLFLVRAGPAIASPRILGSRSWLARIMRASDGLDDLLRRPSADGLLGLSEQFTDRLHLGSPSFRRTVRALRRTGSWAAQAMFGNALFVVPRTAAARERILETLAERDLPALEARVAHGGARRLAASVGE